MGVRKIKKVTVMGTLFTITSSYEDVISLNFGEVKGSKTCRIEAEGIAFPVWIGRACRGMEVLKGIEWNMEFGMSLEDACMIASSLNEWGELRK